MNLVTNYFYYRYPQYCWAQEIKKILNSEIISDIHDKIIVDAPCGDGIISFWLIKSSKNKFYLFDNEKTRIEIAQKNIKADMILKENIFELKLKATNNVWLFINSLYCLPDKEKLLKNMIGQMEYVIAVFPYTNHLNYKTYFQANPGFNNPSEMNKEETILFFKDFQYDLILTKDVTKFSYYKKKLPFLNSLLNKIFILFERFKNNNSSAYWIGIFKRNNE